MTIKQKIKNIEASLKIQGLKLKDVLMVKTCLKGYYWIHFVPKGKDKYSINIQFESKERAEEMYQALREYSKNI